MIRFEIKTKKKTRINRLLALLIFWDTRWEQKAFNTDLLYYFLLLSIVYLPLSSTPTHTAPNQNLKDLSSLNHIILSLKGRQETTRTNKKLRRTKQHIEQTNRKSKRNRTKSQHDIALFSTIKDAVSDIEILSLFFFFYLRLEWVENGTKASDKLSVLKISGNESVDSHK